MAPDSQPSIFKFLELTPSQPRQPVDAKSPTLVKDTETDMDAPSQSATSTKFLKLTCSAPTQPASSPSPTMIKQTQTLPEKEKSPKLTLSKPPELSMGSNIEFASQEDAAAYHVDTTDAASPRSSTPQVQTNSLKSE